MKREKRGKRRWKRKMGRETKSRERKVKVKREYLIDGVTVNRKLGGKKIPESGIRNRGEEKEDERR